jgi:hypothetical protein
MAHCKGAILLLTEKALLSPWVLKEATILAWRRSLDPTFKLIPVLLGIKSNAIVNATLFNPLDLSEIEALKGLADLPLAKALAELLEPLRALESDTPRRLLENKIANLLEDVKKPALLQQVANNLDQDLGGWNPRCDAQTQVAVMLLQAPMEKLAEGLSPLVGAVPKEKLVFIVDMLRGSWVNPELAGLLTVAARKPKGRRAVALNGTELDFTAKAVIARATSGYPFWSFIAVSNAAGEDQRGSLIAQVSAAFERTVGSKDPAKIKAYIEKKDKREPTLIVIAPADREQGVPEDADLDALMTAYPLCTVFLLSGPVPPPAERLPTLLRLIPNLGPTEEIEAFATFRDLEIYTGTAR